MATHLPRPRRPFFTHGLTAHEVAIRALGNDALAQPSTIPPLPTTTEAFDLADLDVAESQEQFETLESNQGDAVVDPATKEPITDDDSVQIITSDHEDAAEAPATTEPITDDESTQITTSVHENTVESPPMMETTHDIGSASIKPANDELLDAAAGSQAQRAVIVISDSEDEVDSKVPLARVAVNAAPRSSITADMVQSFTVADVEPPSIRGRIVEDNPVPETSGGDGTMLVSMQTNSEGTATSGTPQLIESNSNQDTGTENPPSPSQKLSAFELFQWQPAITLLDARLSIKKLGHEDEPVVLLVRAVETATKTRNHRIHTMTMATISHDDGKPEDNRTKENNKRKASVCVRGLERSIPSPSSFPYNGSFNRTKKPKKWLMYELAVRNDHLLP
ncbi:hypothetical protein LTR10_018286 [Elasticomyces elasticus]|uniref:Uncharacterized protein n=1 Tax=Exophiala sideris TaxID=1016849 RepID=A0ABR0JM47_9EURO|nr:hypothetical protein LTR10_018286 [Elasticomyces elasticus]KAK5036676.1 hypothetical protein LTS07_002404 [Exophiala sideris]KAK5041497.1 hypothetical protein LTR13_002162 [Exophiala sideris]KAK5067060.1 hypothetical protein LTR69_002409 [Exophiala sideris]KAK5185118.1 hypothetical protein LTR44_002965 [Eurotiomycetes sp. CCFEE 6388]